MTAAERADVIALLQKSEKAFLDAVEGLTDAQWAFKPAPERWSVGEVAQHIVLADALLLETAQKIIGGPEDPEWTKTTSLTERLKQALPNRSRKVDAPEAIKPVQPLTRAQVMARFTEGRARALKFARETNAPIKAYTARNPFFGMLNAYQWLIYIPLHHLRHNQQIAEVKTTAGFPH